LTADVTSVRRSVSTDLTDETNPRDEEARNMSANNRIAVAGATGRVGHHAVDVLRERGHDVVPTMRTQLVAARTVAEALADLAVDPASAPGPTLEVAGPREESLVEMAKLLVSRRRNGLRVDDVSDAVDGDANESGVLLPGPGARLAGPTFEEWLDSVRH
jgi:uncharacterized protein YbjT (DUF2867 family)